MKKRFMFLMALCIVLATGCGNEEKTLTCTNTDDKMEGATATQVVKVDFVGSEVTTLNMDIDVDVDEQYKDYMSIFTSSMEEQFASFETETGMNVDIKEEGTSVLVKLNADYTKMDSATKEDLGIVTDGESYDSMKKSFEDEGYTCK